MSNPNSTTLRDALNIVLGFALILCLLMLLLSSCEGDPPSPMYATATVERDTIIQYVPGDTVVVQSARPTRMTTRSREIVTYVDTIRTVVATDTVVHYDTVLTAQPFDWRLDTIVGADTIGIGAGFPPPRLSLDVRQGPDSIQKVYETVTITLPPIKTPWYEKGTWFVGGSLFATAVYVANDAIRRK